MTKKQVKFNWTKKRIYAAEALADGYTVKEVAKQYDIPSRTIYRWTKIVDFATEVNRLALMTGIAAKAERIKIAKRVARQEMMGDIIMTKKDVLEWLKFAADETDEVRLNLADLIRSNITTKREEDAPVSEGGSDRGNADNSGE